MERRGRKIRFAAVSVLVVLALTGFSTGRSRGHGDDDGGGCSSSGQDHDGTSTSGGSSSGGSGSSSGGTSGTPQDAEVVLVSCATRAEPYAVVEVTNPNTKGARFSVTVRFLGADEAQVDVRTVDEFVAANGTAEVRVPLGDPGLAADVDTCAPDASAPAG